MAKVSHRRRVCPDPAADLTVSLRSPAESTREPLSSTVPSNRSERGSRARERRRSRSSSITPPPHPDCFRGKTHALVCPWSAGAAAPSAGCLPSLLHNTWQRTHIPSLRGADLHLQPVAGDSHPNLKIQGPEHFRNEEANNRIHHNGKSKSLSPAPAGHHDRFLTFLSHDTDAYFSLTPPGHV